MAYSYNAFPTGGIAASTIGNMLGVAPHASSWVGQTVFDGSGNAYVVPQNVDWGYFHGKYTRSGCCTPHCLPCHSSCGSCHGGGC